MSSSRKSSGSRGKGSSPSLFAKTAAVSEGALFSAALIDPQWSSPDDGLICRPLHVTDYDKGKLLEESHHILSFLASVLE